MRLARKSDSHLDGWRRCGGSVCAARCVAYGEAGAGLGPTKASCASDAAPITVWLHGSQAVSGGGVEGWGAD